MKKLNVVDLFAGAGGNSLGLHRAGSFKTVAFCEINEFRQERLVKNFPGKYIFKNIHTNNLCVF